MNRQQLMKPIETNKDHIYYNIKIHNDGIDDTNIPIYFNENRGQHLVEKASDYYVSIIRFSLESTNLPVLMMRPDTSLITNPNKNRLQLVYKMSFSADNFNTRTQIKTRNVIFIPPIDNTNNTTLEFNEELKYNSFYYLYNIQQFIRMLNKTSEDLLNELKTSYSGISGLPPIFTFEPSSGIISIKYHPITNTTLPEGQQSFTPTIVLNHSLYSALSGFSFNYDANYADEYKLLPDNIKRNPDYRQAGEGDLGVVIGEDYPYIISQDYPSISILNPISSIAFSTSRLPIQPTQEAKPLIIGGTSLFGINNGENNDFSPIINDFSIYNENGYAYKPSVYYTPGSEYKLNDLFGSNPIQHVDILCDWIDIYGRKHQMFLESQNSAEIQLLFRKKTFQTLKKL